MQRYRRMLVFLVGMLAAGSAFSPVHPGACPVRDAGGDAEPAGRL
jgi:hypothetical protein